MNRDPETMYLDYFDNFLTLERFAEYYGLTLDDAWDILEAGRKIVDERVTS